MTVTKRSLKLIFIGIFIINNAYDLKKMRIPGVLQRISVCYFVLNFIIIFVPRCHVIHNFVSNFREFTYHWISFGGLLFIYIGITYFS